MAHFPKIGAAPRGAVIAFALAAADLLVVPTRGLAYDFEVSARTEAYAYQLRRFERDGLILLNRRRITQYLGLRIFNLLEPGQDVHSRSRPKRPPALLYAHGLMRFASDFGDFVDVSASDSPELRNDQFELLLGALEGRNLWGYVNFSLGRQYDAELMDFFAYDGMRVRLDSPWKLFVESHFGAQVNRTLPFSAAVFETDGTSGEEAEDKPLAPTFGVAFGLDDPELLELRIAYRRAFSRSDLFLDADSLERRSVWGVDQELFFAHIALPVVSWGSRVAGALRYNLLTSSFDELQLNVAQALAPGHQITLEVLRSRPHFDGDSIFNIFALEPFSELGGRYSGALGAGLLVETRGGYRWFWTAEEETEETSGYALSVLLAWSHAKARAEAELFLTDGYGGRRFGGDLSGWWSSPRWVFGRRIALDGRVSLVQFSDARADLDPLLTLGLQLGAQIRFLPGLSLYLSVEDNINRLYDSALRFFAALDMAFAP